jgi:hypothetical protein
MTETESKIDIFMPAESGDETVVSSYWVNLEPKKMVEYLEANNIPKYDYDLDDDDYYKGIIYWSVSFDNWFWITTPVSKYQTVRQILKNLPRRNDPLGFHIDN